jgi:hypothetical protein
MGTQRWIGLPYAGITQIRFKEYFSAALASGTSSTIDYGSTQWRKPATCPDTLTEAGFASLLTESVLQGSFRI